MVRSSWRRVRGGRSRAVAPPPGCLSSFHLRPMEPEPAHLPSWEHHHPLRPFPPTRLLVFSRSSFYSLFRRATPTLPNSFPPGSSSMIFDNHFVPYLFFSLFIYSSFLSKLKNSENPRDSWSIQVACNERIHTGEVNACTLSA